MSIRRIFGREPELPVQPRATPEPARAAELERKFAELSYQPENGFHRDCQQPRLRRKTR